MKNTLVPLVAFSLLAMAGTSHATEEDADEDTAAEEAAEASTDKLEAQLEAARERLEEAAHEVAELSGEIGRPLMDRFMTFGEGPRRAIIGVQLDPASGKDGARVREVSPGGPAAEAGIQPKDVIVMVNGTQVKGDSTREVSRLIRGVKPDSHVKVRVLREGKPKDFVVIARPTVFAFSNSLPPLPPLPPHAPGMEEFDAGVPFTRAFGGDFADMELAALTPDLGRYFGTSEGVLVVRAPKEEGLKLEDGDVILSIDGRKPTSGSHASRILRSYQPGEKVALRVMRQKKAVDLNVILPERKNPFPGNRVFRTEEPS
jgi:predicted metalloprotease with PDZ domain